MAAEHAVVRPARPDDLDELVELVRDHAAYERAAAPRPDLASALADLLFGATPRLRAFVAAAGAVTDPEHPRLLGYATWTLEASTFRAREYAHLDCLYLREHARGGGLGRRLLDAVAADARLAGAGELGWQTPDWNEGGIRFYRRTGAVEASKLRFSLAI